MNKFLLFLLIVALLYTVLCILVYIFQSKFIYHPEKGYSPPPENMNIKEIMIPTSDNEQLHSWWMFEDSSTFTVLFFHGNAGNISRGEKRMKLYHEMGFNVLAIDYREFGKSTGTIECENDFYTDASASYSYLVTQLKIPEEKIIIWGWSLGGAVAVDLAQQKNCRALVMESTFYSMTDMAKRSFGFLPIKYLLKFHFNSGEKMKKVTCPVLFIHSPDDKTVPYLQGQKLFHNFSGKKDFITISGDHNHGIFDSKDLHINSYLEFLKNN